MELFDLTGKVAVVTGSTKGIGKAIAERLAEHGAKVAISSRKAIACETVAGAINAKYPGAAIAVPANISSKDDLRRLVDETRAAFGKIDILVCNAASNPLLRTDVGAAGRCVPQDPRQQYHLQSLADPHGRRPKWWSVT